jgi:glycerophosphoryl diester phosphodiesterase
MSVRLGILCLLASVMMQPAQRIEVHGHRGATLVLPENTIPGFEHAIEAGADYIELDTWVTKDNVVVVSHDPFLHPPMCSGPEPKAVIRQLTLEQVKQWDCGSAAHPKYPGQKPAPGARIPTLDEVLALASRGNHFRFNIEIKSSPEHPELAPPLEEYVRLVYDSIRRNKVEARSQVQSFDWRVLHEMRKIAPKLQMAALYGSGPMSFPRIAADTGVKIIAPQFRLATPEKVKEAHSAGLKVVVWTVDEPQDWDRLIDAGVDGIITDQPKALIEHLKKRGLR